MISDLRKIYGIPLKFQQISSETETNIEIPVDKLLILWATVIEFQ